MTDRLHAAPAALRRDLADMAARLVAGELRVLLVLATGAWVGQTRYGCLRLADDRRDFHAEAGDELVDACFYLTTAVLRVAGKRRRRLRRHV